jgi:hypothetical protein
MRNSRADSASIKNCAAHHGITERAVRTWRLKDDPRWKAWLARSARSATQLDAFAVAGDIPTDPASEAEAARRRFVLLTKMVDEATARGEVAGLAVLIRSAQEAQRLLAACRSAESEWRERSRLLIPASEWVRFREEILEPLFLVMKNMPSEACMAANPESPDVAQQALNDWLTNRLRPHMVDVFSSIDAAVQPPTK